MGYKATVFQLTRVDLTEKYYAMVAPLDKEDADDASWAATNGQANARISANQEATVRWDNRIWSNDTLVKGIKEWNLDDDAGNILPITLETVKGLANGHAQKLLNAISSLTNPLANPETVKN